MSFVKVSVISPRVEKLARAKHTRFSSAKNFEFPRSALKSSISVKATFQQITRTGKSYGKTQTLNAVPEVVSEAVETVEKPTEQQSLMLELAEFLKEDLTHLFDDQGIDVSRYDEKVSFEDPLTRYDSISGYLFNIQFLRRVFEPEFFLHSVNQTGPYELTTRWTMGMKLGWFPLKQWYMPSFLFTGTSIMGVNPETGRFNSHRDTWDSIKDQEYLSTEGVMDLIKQLGEFYKTPDLKTPEYMVMKRLSDFEVRRYSSFVVAEADMQQSSSSSSAPGGAASKSAFQALAGYIFGQNQQMQKMDMTTPVFTTSSEDDRNPTMQFVVPSDSTKVGPKDFPAPLTSDIRLSTVTGGYFATLAFPGVATSEMADDAANKLRQSLIKLGYNGTPGYRLARYNDPSTPGFFRRNEVLIELVNFQLE